MSSNLDPFINVKIKGGPGTGGNWVERKWEEVVID